MSTLFPKWNKERVRYFDSFLVMLNISTYCSVVPYIVFHQYARIWNIFFITILNVVFLYYRSKKQVKIPKDILFRIFVCINVINIASTFLSEGLNLLPFCYSCMNISFYILLYNLYCEYRKTDTAWKSLWCILRGYVWLALLAIGTSIVLFLLIKVGFDPLKTPVVDKYYDLFKSNSEIIGHTYYYPFYISVLLTSKYGVYLLPFFQEYGIICGVFHEPHVITLVVFPVFFILWAYLNNKVLKFACACIWIFVLLLETSTTNILAFLLSIFVLALFNKNMRLWLIPFFVFFIYLFVSIGIENTDFYFIVEKLDSGDTSSRDYSLGTIEFAFTPRSLLGSNFMSNDYLTTYSTLGRRDVGYLSFFFNLIFLIIFIFRIVRTIVSSERYRLLGIAALYFLIHSMKTAMTTYTMPQLIMIMFILYIVKKTRNIDEQEYLIPSVRK